MHKTYDEIHDLTNNLIRLTNDLKQAQKDSNEILEYMISFDIINRAQAGEIINLRTARDRYLICKESFRSMEEVLFSDFVSSRKKVATMGINMGSDYYLAKKYTEASRGVLIRPDQYLVFLIATLLD